MKNNKYIIALIALSLILTSCGSHEEKSIVDNTPPVLVKVNSIQTNENSSFISASGKVEAEKSANLSTRMMGYVTKVNVKMGQKVSKGQLLVSINNTDLQAKSAQVNASILKAEAGYNSAKKDYDRYVSLFNQQSASQKEMDDMAANFEMAKAGLEGAKQMKNEVNAQFSYANIRAPFSGVVTNTFVKEGDMANPGMPLVSVESPSKLQVTAMVAESDILQIKTGIKVEVLIKSMDKVITGKVIEISTSAKNTGGQYLVKIALDKTDAKVLSGMFTTVQFPIAKKENATTMVFVPTTAIIENGGLKGVYTVSKQNTALLRWLRLGKTYGDNVEVLSGLNSEEPYIVSAEGKLFNGVKVTLK